VRALLTQLNSHARSIYPKSHSYQGVEVATWWHQINGNGEILWSFILDVLRKSVCMWLVHPTCLSTKSAKCGYFEWLVSSVGALMPSAQINKCFLDLLVALIHSVKEVNITFTNFPHSLIGIFSVVESTWANDIGIPKLCVCVCVWFIYLYNDETKGQKTKPNVLRSKGDMPTSGNAEPLWLATPPHNEESRNQKSPIKDNSRNHPTKASIGALQSVKCA
jgi:hypothetical protein